MNPTKRRLAKLEANAPPLAKESLDKEELKAEIVALLEASRVEAEEWGARMDKLSFADVLSELREIERSGEPAHADWAFEEVRLGKRTSLISVLCKKAGVEIWGVQLCDLARPAQFVDGVLAAIEAEKIAAANWSRPAGGEALYQ
jgi:hypothetical protein